jgi:Pectate lyase superfamily protein
LKTLFKAAIAALFVALVTMPTQAANRIQWPYGLVPPSSWLNQGERYERLGEGAFKTAIFGTGGSYQNLSVMVTSPTSLSVNVGPTNSSAVGSIYQFIQDDANSFGNGPINSSTSLPADPTMITVQGTTQANSTVGPLTVPGSNSQISLIECQVTSIDTTPMGESFYNLGNVVAASVNRDRIDSITCQAKAGTSSSSPVVPTVDSGWIAIGYVTIPSGTTTITSGMITASPGLGHAVMDGAASTQTIQGAKTFSIPPVLSGASITNGTIPSAALVTPPITSITAGSNAVVTGGATPSVGVTAAPSFSGPVTASSLIGDVPNGVFNVKSPPYNAAGNGTTDDTAAIQAAVNAAIAAKGGTIYFPAGNYKVSSTITIASTGSVGIIVRGSGTGAYTPSGGSTIQVAFASGDVFYMPGAVAGNLGDPAFFDLNVDASSVTRASGATFDYKYPSNGQISHVYTNRDYDAVAWGTPGADTQNMIDIHDSEFFQVRHDVFHQTGDTNGGGTYIHDILAYGNGTEESAGTNYAYVQDSGAIVDPIYMTNVDFEGLANGYYANISSGYINDAFYSNIIFDGVPNGAGMEFRTTGTGFIENVHLANIWSTTHSTADSIILDAENLQSTSAGVHLFTIDGITASSQGGNCMSFSNGVTDVTVTNSHFYSCPSGNGIASAGSSSVSNKNIIVSGSHFGSIFGQDSFGVASVYTSGLTLTGNDFTGVSTDALAFGGTNTGFTAAGNNMTGVGVISGTLPTDSLIRGNKGYATETSDATSTTTRFTYNALTACTGSNLLTDAKNAGTSEFHVDCSGNGTLGGSTLTLGGSGGPTFGTGSGAPSGACVNGSLYIRTDGSAGAGSTSYDCRGTAWQALTGG